MWAGLINSQDIAEMHISVFFPIDFCFLSEPFMEYFTNFKNIMAKL
jgi:hypothetical protein